ncbi:hypothetical protein HAZT_HAZT004841 [Hyalella azteca]|uniref:ubiquitinyl hydrolase 1 n=1 Tax=Hyalella azteca TaxID=294128 RepID=A0A6A0H3V8_HYAAZ|nr:hypothetical protein HAZT_HAZT004841 [Hyalella azteca]
MSGGDGEENQKWPCNLCTYLNYQSAHRCTMCGSSRPVQQIIPTNQSSSFDTDPLPSAPSPPPRPHDSGGEKWACTRCTYLNYPRAIRCSQCSSQKNSCSVSPTDIRDDAFGAHSPPSQQTSRATMSPQSSSPTFKISLGSPTKVVHSPSHKARLSPPLKSRQSPPSKSRQSPSLKSRQSPPLKLHQSSPKGRRSPPRQGSPKQGPKTPNSKSRVNHETQTSPSGIPSPEQQCTLQHKWCCPACTYENWPRSVRCIMCTTPKTALSRDLDGSKHNVPVPPNGSYETSKSRLGCSGTTSTSESQTDAEFESTVSGDAGVRGRANEGAIALNNYETERLLRQLRRRLRDADLAFLNACLAVVEGNYEPVERYLSAGGDPMRKLTSTDIKLLARPSAFDEGHTLVHLAIRFGREDLLDTILSGIHGGGCGAKRVPCFVAPELATDIRRSIAASLRQRREAFPCYCVSEFVTYSLPPEIEHLGSTSVQDRLWDELLDRDVQKQLEEDAPIINWSLELTERLGSRLYALWNRTAGDCLLDSVLQATWGVFDRDNCLRHALAASITDASHLLYPRWKEYERLQARMLDYAVPENQVLEEWAELVCLASQPGAALDQLHIFVLAHILRRPIIVYGVKCVKSFRGEDLGFARFEGVYLPFLWDASFCCKSPIALGYTRGHFCALVPICPQSLPASAAGAILDPGESQLVFLPLMSSDGKLLPVHFLSQAEVGCEAGLLREWLEVCQSDTGLLVAQQKLHKKPLPVAQMTEEWLNYYRTMA